MEHCVELVLGSRALVESLLHVLAKGLAACLGEDHVTAELVERGHEHGA